MKNKKDEYSTITFLKSISIKKPQYRSKDLFQIILCHGPLLIFTEQEFQKAIRRGKSIIYNRLLKNRVLDPDILKGRLIQNE